MSQEDVLRNNAAQFTNVLEAVKNDVAHFILTQKKELFYNGGKKIER